MAMLLLPWIQQSLRIAMTVAAIAIFTSQYGITYLYTGYFSRQWPDVAGAFTVG